MIGIIDYKAGNAQSVDYALKSLGAEYRRVQSTQELEGCRGLILSGMTSADAAIISLEAAELLEGIQRKVLLDRTPFLGIAVGMQILFEHSEEEDTPCLGWLPGEVHELSGSGTLRIGYDRVRWSRQHPLTEGCEPEDEYYFAHAYFAQPEDPQLLLGESRELCCAAAWRNIMGVQFQPEKSGGAGLKLISNFVRIAETGVELC